MKAKYGKLEKLIMTCSCCPSQWEGETENNEIIYARYRFGNLTIQMSKQKGGLDEAVNSKPVFQLKIGNELDGVMSGDELRKIILENNLFEI